MAITKVEPLDKYLEFYKQKYTEPKEKEISAIKKQSELLKASAEGDYKSQIKNIDKKYADLERALLINRIVNERKIKEQNENLGLTSSGKNLTELSAAQISYLNSLNQSAISKLSDKNAAETNKIKSLGSIETTAAKDLAALEKEYQKLVNTDAQKAYSKDTSAALKEKELAFKNTTSSNNDYQQILTEGIKNAMQFGSGYLHNFILSLNLTKEQLPLLRSALTKAGIPADFYDKYTQDGYMGMQLIPIN